MFKNRTERKGYQDNLLHSYAVELRDIVGDINDGTIETLSCLQENLERVIEKIGADRKIMGVVL